MGNFLFTINDFVSFVTDRQSMFFISNRFINEKIDGVCVTQFQIDYICDTNISNHKHTWLNCVVIFNICVGVTNNCNRKVR